MTSTAGVTRPSEAAARPRVDAVSLLSVYVVLTLLLPSGLVVPALGAAGSPAAIMAAGLGLLVLAWAAMGRVPPHPGVRPVAAAATALCVCLLVSYAAGTVRPISAVEVRSADRGLIAAAGWLGVLFLALYGTASRERLERLLGLVVGAVGVSAVIGIIQFNTGLTLVDHIDIPGLSAHQDPGGVSARAGFVRPSGMSSHPIEFAVVLTMALPLALHFALHPRRGGPLWRRWWPVAAMALAIPQSLSRSAIVGLVVGMLIVVPGWTRRQRRLGAAVTTLLLVGIYVAIPGILGTLARLFTGISTDGSAASRTDSYGLAWSFIEASPLVGRGFSTFLPSYRILDNQYLGLLIETGCLGLASLLAVFLAAIGLGFRATRSSRTRPADSSLARAMTASVCVGAVGFATFDALGFPQVPGLLFAMVGLLGSYAASQRPVTQVR